MSAATRANDYLGATHSLDGTCGVEPCDVPLLCGICDEPGCYNRNWVDVNFMYWNYDGFRVPNLVAASADGTPRANVGRLGDPATTMLLGNERVGEDWRAGLNINFGRYLDSCGTWAISGSLWALDNGESSQTFPSNAGDIISRPFFNLDPSVNAWDSELVNYPGIVDGTLSIATDSEIYSTSVGLQKKLCCCSDPCTGYGKRVDFFVGYRALSLEESLVISESLSPVGAFITPGTTIDLFDSFETQNRFHGIELGLSKTIQRRRLTLKAFGKVAIGNIRQTVAIDGRTTITVPGVVPSSILPHGLLATESNIGVYQRDRFGVLAQAQLELGYQVSCRLKMKLGYNLIFVNDLARAGGSIDPFVNATQIDPNVAVTGLARPHFNWKSEEMLLHGFNVGFEYRF